MTSIADMASLAAAAAGAYRRCAPEQALVYSCEDVLESHVPSRSVAADDIAEFVFVVCESEGMDIPLVGPLRRGSSTRRRTVATADIDADEVRFESRGATVTTILHELAHLASGMDDHGVLFRDEYVRLVRRHCDVDQAATLHGLFVACGLEMSPWPASAR